MSTSVFPTLAGIEWNISKSPEFKTQSQETESGKVYRAKSWVYPKWHYSLSYEFLRDDIAYNELKQVVGFFLSRYGSFDNFNFLDPDNYIADNQLIGLGNGATTTFQLVSDFNGFAEPVYRPVYDAGLFQFPENFENSYWSKNTGTSINPNKALAPDNTQTADEMVEDTSTPSGFYFTTGSNVTLPASPSKRWITLSAHVKRGSGTRNAMLRLRLLRIDTPITTATDSVASFDLGSGTVVSVTIQGDAGGEYWSDASATITPLANGWYRVSVTALQLITQLALSSSHVRMTNAAFATGYTGDGTSSIFVWGVKLELSTRATPYLPAPKIYQVDWQGTRLLSSTVRYNKVKYSEDITQGSVWLLAAATVTSNTAVAPDGTTTADTVTDNSAGSFGAVYQFWTVPNDTTTRYTLSMYVRKTSGGTSPTFGINFHFTQGTTSAFNTLRLNTDSGAILAFNGNGTWSVTSFNTDWWKVLCVDCFNNTSGNNRLTLSIYPATGSNNSAVDNVATTGSAIIWGMQVDLSSSENVYVKTASAEFAGADYSINSEGLVTFTVAPASGVQLRWTGAYYQRVTFEDDIVDFRKFMTKLWDAKRVDLVTDK